MVLKASNKPEKIMAYTDNSSALGWLYKALFANSMPCHDNVARQMASDFINNDSALYSQHIKGIYNIIADSLSRDHHLTNELLTKTFLRLYP